MIKVLFICHGNICRSPLAEYLFKDMVKKAGREYEFEIASAATSYEEYGNPVYPPVKRMLNDIGIDCSEKRAYRMDKSDYNKYDLLVCMDSNNLRNLRRIIGEDTEHKVHLLMEYTGITRDVADPYYSGDFDATWQDINKGCRALLEALS
ncbi:MAG: low molecular weight protein-tyrosine-phosphatase [Eubacteriales bacterium]|nr:low molecular weight protein-tyrosine-phosphatase [Eubacteriales bacterium]